MEPAARATWCLLFDEEGGRPSEPTLPAGPGGVKGAGRSSSVASALRAQDRGERLGQALQLRVAHRRGEAAEPGDRHQHAALHEPADDPVQARLLLGRGARAAVVDQLAVGRVHAEERALAGDRAGHPRALEAGLEAAALPPVGSNTAITSVRPATAPTGKPPPMILPSVVMSGVTPNTPWAPR